MLDVSCPSCGETYHVAAEHAGRSLKCRRCDRVFQIEVPSHAATSSSARGGAPAAATSTATAPAPASATAAAAPTHPVDVSDTTFERDVLRSNVPVVVDFWASWCGPCRAVAPAVQQLAAEYGGRVKFAKLNADENPRVMATYGVQGLPTLILFRGGREVNRLVGAHPKANIKRLADLAA